jgi:hypothetical protein
MLRTVTAAALLGCTLLIASACSINPEHIVEMEVTGTTPSAVEISYAYPGNDKAAAERNVALPWRKKVTTEFGIVKIDATPTTGLLTCRIVADGKEIAKVTGAEGAVARCWKIVNDK